MFQHLNAPVRATNQEITLSFVDIHHLASAPILKNFTIHHHSITHISHPHCTSFTCSLKHLRHNPCWTSWPDLLHLTNYRIHFQYQNHFTRPTHWTCICQTLSTPSKLLIWYPIIMTVLSKLPSSSTTIFPILSFTQLAPTTSLFLFTSCLATLNTFVFSFSLYLQILRKLLPWSSFFAFKRALLAAPFARL